MALERAPGPLTCAGGQRAWEAREGGRPGRPGCETVRRPGAKATKKQGKAHLSDPKSLPGLGRDASPVPESSNTALLSLSPTKGSPPQATLLNYPALLSR